MSPPTKRCSRCGATKPRSEFYIAHKATATRQAKLRTMCKECDNTRQRAVNANQPRINRQRARNRAIADLIKFHEDEFATLYEIRLAEATDEAEALRQSDEAREHYKDEPVRLRPGQRRQGQKAGDRIDVARCPHCIKHHDRGHVCVKCGAAPPKWTGRRDDGILDEVAIQRRMNGDKDIPLSKPERTELVRRCRKAGWTYNQIEDLAGVAKSERYIERGDTA